LNKNVTIYFRFVSFIARSCTVARGCVSDELAVMSKYVYLTVSAHVKICVSNN